MQSLTTTVARRSGPAASSARSSSRTSAAKSAPARAWTPTAGDRPGAMDRARPAAAASTSPTRRAMPSLEPDRLVRGRRARGPPRAACHRRRRGRRRSWSCRRRRRGRDGRHPGCCDSAGCGELVDRPTKRRRRARAARATIARQRGQRSWSGQVCWRTTARRRRARSRRRRPRRDHVGGRSASAPSPRRSRPSRPRDSRAPSSRRTSAGSSAPAPNGQRNHGRGSTPACSRIAASASRDVGREARAPTAAASARGSASGCRRGGRPSAIRRAVAGYASAQRPWTKNVARTSSGRERVEQPLRVAAARRPVGMLGVERQRDPERRRHATSRRR